MTTETCKCGKASITYEIVDEDYWVANAKNTHIVKDGYGKKCICKFCNDEYDSFDPCMVTVIEQ